MSTDSAEKRQELNKFLNKNINFKYEPSYQKLFTGWDPKVFDYHHIDEIKPPILKINFLERIPHQEMLNEALNLLDYFYTHRKDSYKWKALTLYGLSHSHTGIISEYGYEETDENYKKYCTYTDICRNFCPVTHNFLKETLKFDLYTRVRFMLLEPGGYIAPHRDKDFYGFGSTNLVLSQPDGCDFHVGEIGKLPLKPGDLFFFDNGYEHAVTNNSDKPRVHMIIHGNTNQKYWHNIVVNSLKKACRDS